MFTTILALIQTTLPEATRLPEMVVPGGIAGLVLWFWRQDRKDREAERQRSEERWAKIAEDFREIVEANTAANVALREAVMQLAGRPKAAGAGQ